jgi:hypothetical protein
MICNDAAAIRSIIFFQFVLYNVANSTVLFCMYRSTYPSPGTREYMSGAAAAMVALLKHRDVRRRIG